MTQFLYDFLFDKATFERDAIPALLCLLLVGVILLVVQTIRSFQSDIKLAQLRLKNERRK